MLSSTTRSRDGHRTPPVRRAPIAPIRTSLQRRRHSTLGAVTRLYVDDAGRMNQSVARVAERVTFVAAGLPLELKAFVA